MSHEVDEERTVGAERDGGSEMVVAVVAVAPAAPAALAQVQVSP